MSRNDEDVLQAEEAPKIAPSTSDTCTQSTEKRHLPTDSMITVRLSGSSSTSIQDRIENSRYSTSNSVRKSIRFSQPPIVEECLQDIPDDPSINEEDREMSDDQDGRASKMTLNSIQEGDSIMSGHSTNRSRSDSSGTMSSNGSAQVDWDELDKSEEQAPRDEGSDEVGNNGPSLTKLTSTPGHRFFAREIGAGEQCARCRPESKISQSTIHPKRH